MFQCDLGSILAAANVKIQTAKRAVQIELNKAFHGISLDDAFERLGRFKRLRDSICKQMAGKLLEKKVGKVLAHNKMCRSGHSNER